MFPCFLESMVMSNGDKKVFTQYSGFLSPQKSAFPNSNFSRNGRQRPTTIFIVIYYVYFHVFIVNFFVPIIS